MINLVDERQYILRYHHFIMTFVNRYMISNLNFRGILDLSVQFRLNRIRSRHFEKINSQRSELFLSQDTHPCKGLRYGGFSFSVLFLWPSLSVSDQFDLLILIYIFTFLALSLSFGMGNYISLFSLFLASVFYPCLCSCSF